MLSNYSVRRPYTVFVAVILVIVLGVISFTGMTTDLLPSIDLPYVIVITPYPGASPEKVEQTVTRPLEAALGTAGGLKNISSVSSENSSTIILEYVQNTNMDSAIIDLSGSLDLVSAGFDNMVGSPMLMRISPDMMPIIVASVDRDDMDIAEISQFASDTVIPAFERIDGVASVSPGGLLNRSIEIELNPEAVELLNQKIRTDLEAVFAENRQSLDTARSELAAGRQTLESESPDQKDQLAKASSQLTNAMSNLNALLAEEALLDAQRIAFEQERQALEPLIGLDLVFKQLFPDGVAKLTPEMYQAVMLQLAPNLPPEFADLDQAQMAELVDRAATAQSRVLALDIELQNIEVRALTLAAMTPQLEAGLAQAQKSYEELESGKITMAVEMARAQIQIENGESELEQGLLEFEQAREEALEAADLNQILTKEMIEGLLQAQNFNMPAGYIIAGSDKHLVKVGDSLSSFEELQDLVLFNTEATGDIRLADIASVVQVDNADELYAKINGNESVLLTFQKQSTASTAEVAESVKKQISSLQQEYEGLSITLLMDQGEYIDMITGSVISNLLIGGLLAILLLLIFLRDLRPTIVIAFSIPISLMFAVTMMYFSNVTLNIISLSGLALGVGMLVDNSIVVIENIYRLRHEGVSAAKAAVQGAREVAGAIFASTLTTICVFLPIVFTQGLSRQLFADMGLTIAFSLLASLIVALTLVPAMGATLLRSTREKQHHWFDKIVVFYGRLLRFSLRRKAVVLISSLLLLALSIYGVTVMGTAFMSEVDSPQMSATMSMPRGSTREQTYAMNDKMIERIMEIEAVETVGALGGEQSGMMMMGGGGDSQTTFYILLKDQRSLSNTDVEKLIYEKTADLEAELSVSASNMDMSALGGSGISVNIRGNDLDQLAEISRDVAGLLVNTEGTINVESGLAQTERETRIIVDKAKAIREGLTVAQIYASISEVLAAQTEATILEAGTDSYPVLLVNTKQAGITKDNLPDYRISAKQQDGTAKSVRLGDIAQITEADSLDSIRRESQSRYMTVTADIADGYNIGLVSRDFEETLDKYQVPEGYELEIAGENESISEAMSDLVLMIILAIIFIYLIMVAQFQDLTSPFIVLFTLPLAFTGGLLLLWTTGMELSVIAMLGFLVLAGIVVNNGIVFVSYVNQLRESGVEQQEALVQTGLTRIRPILMTALTTILAMSTMAFGLGDGAEMMQPMAIVTIGGLLYATLLTLLVVPVLYDILHRKALRRIRIEE